MRTRVPTWFFATCLGMGFVTACGVELLDHPDENVPTNNTPDGSTATENDGSPEDVDAATQDADAAQPAQGGYVFVTNGVYSGNLGGIDGADQKCNAAAHAGGATSIIKGRTFKAWITNSSRELRALNDVGGPYRLVTGKIVASSLEDLRNGVNASPIDVDEMGNTTSSPVWIGYNMKNPTLGLNCDSWTTDAQPKQGIYNYANQKLGAGQEQDSCDKAKRIYCIEQP